MGEIAALRSRLDYAEKGRADAQKERSEANVHWNDAITEISTLKAQLEREREARKELLRSVEVIKAIGDSYGQNPMPGSTYDVCSIAAQALAAYAASKESK